VTPLPVVVIGGGIAGAALGAQVAQSGKPVVIVERRKDPHHKICGEFISAEAAAYLSELNIDLPSLGACRIKSVRLCAGEHMVAADLPFSAFSLSRFVLDEVLLRRAQAFGAQILRGQSVHSLQADDNYWIVELEDGHCLAANDVFLANGKHDIRGWKRPDKRESNFVAFKLHWRLTDEQTAVLRGNVELFLFPGGYAGLELVEDGVANLCLIIERTQFSALGQRWDAVLDLLRTDCPHLAQRLRGATPSWERPLAMTSIPYGHVETRTEGLWRLGDQAAVIPSFAGDGMAIALHSARLAARIFLKGGSPEEFQLRLARDVGSQVKRAALMSSLLVRPRGQWLAAAAARHFPRLLVVAARTTRIAPRHLRAAA
jgi:menaquinone-9 beta-reductase